MGRGAESSLGLAIQGPGLDVKNESKHRYDYMCMLCFRVPFFLLAMSMILSASVVRVKDGLPLSASTDYEQNVGVQECRRYFKILAKRLSQLPDRCTLHTGQYNIK